MIFVDKDERRIVISKKYDLVDLLVSEKNEKFK